MIIAFIHPENDGAYVDENGNRYRVDVYDQDKVLTPEGVSLVAYESIEEVLEAHGLTEFVEPSAQVPIPILSPRQFKEQLIRTGKRTAVLASIAAIPNQIERDITQNWYDNAASFDRSFPLTNALIPVLELTSEELDLWFVEAGQL